MGRRPPFTHSGSARVAVVIFALIAGGPSASQTSLRTVRVAAEGGATVVTLVADGALPQPTVGVLPDPPRIYLDFRDVTTATDGTRAGADLLVRGVRVAVNQPQPLVTRVVIDLVRPSPHRIDAGLRDRGQLTIVVGVPTAVPVAPAPRIAGQDVAENVKAENRPSADGRPEAAARATVPASVPAVPAAVPPPKLPDDTASRAALFAESARAPRPGEVRAPAKDVDQYLRSASAPLERLERLRPVLTSLDARAILPDERLKATAAEFEAIRRTLAAIVPPRTLTAIHQALYDACVLGAASAAARVARAAPDDSTRAWNAASAAAGAIMLIERARAELGLAPSMVR